MAGIVILYLSLALAAFSALISMGTGEPKWKYLWGEIFDFLLRCGFIAFLVYLLIRVFLALKPPLEPRAGYFLEQVIVTIIVSCVGIVFTCWRIGRQIREFVARWRDEFAE